MINSYDDAKTQANLQKLSALKFTASKPLKDLYDFQGKIEVPDGQTIKLDLRNFLHSGSILHNSNKVDAMVVYSGYQTKLAMNLGTPRLKKSRGRATLDLFVMFYFVVTVILTAIMFVKGV